jgi:hypothetical protein
MARSPRPGQSARRPHGRRAEPPGGTAPDLREAILAATARLLAGHSFTDLAVSDILTAAGVSRGTFYFYRQQTGCSGRTRPARRRPGPRCRRAVAGLPLTQSPRPGLRHPLTLLWQASAPVLGAIVENWRTDPRLTALWLSR